MAAVQPQALPAPALSEPAAGLLRRIEAAAKNTGDAASGSGKALPAPLRQRACRLRRPANSCAGPQLAGGRYTDNGAHAAVRTAARGGATGEVRTLPSASVPNAQRSLSEAAYAAPVQPAAFSAETSTRGGRGGDLRVFPADSRRYDNGFFRGNGR
jgi:hypothetical protein